MILEIYQTHLYTALGLAFLAHFMVLSLGKTFIYYVLGTVLALGVFKISLTILPQIMPL